MFVISSDHDGAQYDVVSLAGRAKGQIIENLRMDLTETGVPYL